MPDELISRPCTRCGQAVHPLKDSWNATAGGIEHAVCPTSPEMRDLPAANTIPNTARKTGPLRDPAVAGMPVYLTIAEAAAVLRVSKDTIRNRIRSGDLPAMRLRGGQTVLIDLKEVLTLLEPIPVGETPPPSGP